MNKQQEGSSKRRRVSSSASNRRCRLAPAVDLFVPLPKASSLSDGNGASTGSTEQILWVAQLLDRAAELGYQQIALTHTVYGRPKHPQDAAATALPESLWLAKQQQKQKHEQHSASKVQVLRRLHIVVETLSDTGLYTTTANSNNSNSSNNNSNNNINHLLQDYDIVSLHPRNDACFQAACSASVGSVSPAFDILTLDALLCKMRATDLHAAAQSKITVEVCYGQAVLHLAKRRWWVQSCRAWHNAHTALSQHQRKVGPLRPLVSSGPCAIVENNNNNNNTNTNHRSDTAKLLSSSSLLALRSPADVANVLATVGGWTEAVARAANTAAGADVLEHAQQRRRLLEYGASSNTTKPSSSFGLGTVVVQSVTLVSDPNEVLLLSPSSSVKRRNKKTTDDQENIIRSRNETELTVVGTNLNTSSSTLRDAQVEVAKEENDDDDHGETDGFISF